MRMEKPLLCVAEGETENLMNEAQRRIVVTEKEENKMLSAILPLYKNKKFREEMVLNGR